MVSANSPTVRRPTDPSLRVSPSAVMPDAMLMKTIGTTSMRISRTNSSPRIATLGAAAGHNSASSSPHTIPATTRFHSAVANHAWTSFMRGAPYRLCVSSSCGALSCQG